MDLVIPLIQESLQQPAKDYFEEDGILLWQTALHNAGSPYEPTPETGLISLMPGLLSAIAENMDLLDSLLPLLNSYLLLDAGGVTKVGHPGRVLLTYRPSAIPSAAPSCKPSSHLAAHKTRFSAAWLLYLFVSTLHHSMTLPQLYLTLASTVTS